jgi:hypothetical protein
MLYLATAALLAMTTTDKNVAMQAASIDQTYANNTAGAFDDKVVCELAVDANIICARRGIDYTEAENKCKAACSCAKNDDEIEQCAFDYCEMGGDDEATQTCASENPCPGEDGDNTDDDTGDTPNPPEFMKCKLTGDPHLKTFASPERRVCDLFGLGVFPVVALPGFHGQAFHCPPPAEQDEAGLWKQRPSFIAGAAVKFGNDIVTVVGDTALLVNGEAIVVKKRGQLVFKEYGSLRVAAKFDKKKKKTELRVTHVPTQQKFNVNIFKTFKIGGVDGTQRLDVHVVATNQNWKGLCANMCAMERGDVVQSVEKQDGQVLFSASEVETLTNLCDPQNRAQDACTDKDDGFICEGLESEATYQNGGMSTCLIEGSTNPNYCDKTTGPYSKADHTNRQKNELLAACWRKNCQNTCQIGCP